MYDFHWTQNDFEKLSKFKNEMSYENLFQTSKKKLKMDNSQIEKENEIFHSDEKWTVPDNFQGIPKDDISHIENEIEIINSNEKWNVPEKFEEITPYSGLTELDFGSNTHWIYWPISDFDPNDLNLCAKTNLTEFSKIPVAQESQSYLKMTEFVSNCLEYSYNSDEILIIEETMNEPNFFQDFISMHSNDFSELSEQLEFLEQMHINVPKGTNIFPVSNPSNNAEPNHRALSDKIPLKSSKSVKKSLKPRKSKKVLPTPSEKKEISIPSKIEFNEHFEKKDYVIKVLGKELTLHRGLSDFMKFYSKGNLQEIISYILEKLLDGDLSTYNLNGRNGKTILTSAEDSKKSVPTQIVNALKKLVETLVPKSYFTRQVTLTRMTNNLIVRACCNQKRKFRRKISRTKFLNHINANH